MMVGSFTNTIACYWRKLFFLLKTYREHQETGLWRARAMGIMHLKDETSVFDGLTTLWGRNSPCAPARAARAFLKRAPRFAGIHHRSVHPSNNIRADIGLEVRRRSGGRRRPDLRAYPVKMAHRRSPRREPPG